MISPWKFKSFLKKSTLPKTKEYMHAILKSLIICPRPFSFSSWFLHLIERNSLYVSLSQSWIHCSASALYYILKALLTVCRKELEVTWCLSGVELSKDSRILRVKIIQEQRTNERSIHELFPIYPIALNTNQWKQCNI